MKWDNGIEFAVDQEDERNETDEYPFHYPFYPQANAFGPLEVPLNENESGLDALNGNQPQDNADSFMQRQPDESSIGSETDTDDDDVEDDSQYISGATLPPPLTLSYEIDEEGNHAFNEDELHDLIKVLDKMINYNPEEQRPPGMPDYDSDIESDFEGVFYPAVTDGYDSC